MAIRLIKEVIVIGLKIPSQPMSELLAAQIPEITITKVNSMRKEKKVIKTEETTTNAVRIMIKEETETNHVIIPETDLVNIVAIRIDEITDPVIKGSEIRNHEMAVIDEMKRSTTGRSAKFV